MVSKNIKIERLFSFWIIIQAGVLFASCPDNSDFGVIIEYTPSEDDALQSIEWYSSNNSAFRPSLNIDYISKVESDKYTLKLLINSLESSYNFHYIDINCFYFISHSKVIYKIFVKNPIK